MKEGEKGCDWRGDGDLASLGKYSMDLLCNMYYLPVGRFWLCLQYLHLAGRWLFSFNDLHAQLDPSLACLQAGRCTQPTWWKQVCHCNNLLT